MSDNMKLWQSVFKTHTSAVKPITGKQYKGHSPKPYWLIEQATKTFGPVGIGWGVTVKSERFERLTDTDVLHVAVVAVWYKIDGVRSETFEQMGGTKACYKTSSGSMMIDEDAGKKSVTDGMVKCLSMIGFAGDIFSGRWDDSKYVSDLASEEKAASKPVLPKAMPEGQGLPNSNARSLISAENLEKIEQIAGILKEFVSDEKDVAIYELYTSVADSDEKAALWSMLDSKDRAYIKKTCAALRAEDEKVVK